MKYDVSLSITYDQVHRCLLQGSASVQVRVAAAAAAAALMEGPRQRAYLAMAEHREGHPLR